MFLSLKAYKIYFMCDFFPVYTGSKLVSWALDCLDWKFEKNECLTCASILVLFNTFNRHVHWIWIDSFDFTSGNMELMLASATCSNFIVHEASKVPSSSRQPSSMRWISFNLASSLLLFIAKFVRLNIEVMLPCWEFKAVFNLSSIAY